MLDKYLLNKALNGDEDDAEEFLQTLYNSIGAQTGNDSAAKQTCEVFDEVLALTKKVISSDDNNSNAYYIAGVACSLKSESDKKSAEIYLEKAVTLGNTFAMVNLAYLIHEEDYDRALQLCDEVIKKIDVLGHFAKANIYLEHDDFLNTAKHYRHTYLKTKHTDSEKNLTRSLKQIVKNQRNHLFDPDKNVRVRNLYALPVRYEAAIALDLKQVSTKSYLLQLQEPNKFPGELLALLARDKGLTHTQRLDFVTLLIENNPNQVLQDYLHLVNDSDILEMFAQYYTKLGQKRLAARIETTKNPLGIELPHADTKYKPALEFFARAISYYEKSKQKIDEQYEPYYGLAILMYQSACKAFGSDNNELAFAVTRTYFEKGIQAGSSDCLEFYIDAVASITDQEKPLEMEADEKYTVNNFNSVKEAYEEYRAKLSVQDKQLEKIIKETKLHDIFYWDKQNLASKIDIKFGEVTLETPKEIHALHDLIGRTDISTEFKVNKIEATVIKMQTGFDYYQEETKGIVFNTLSGGIILGGIGISLVATGILAPIGGVLLGIAIAGTVGGVVGAAIGGLSSKAFRNLTESTTLRKLYDSVIRSKDNTSSDAGTNTYSHLMANVAARNAEFVDEAFNKQQMEDIIQYVDLHVDSKQNLIQPAETDQELPLLRRR